MIKTITVTNSQDESLTLELTKPLDTGIWVVNVDGLGPVKANISTSEVVTYDGTIFNSVRAEERNIVLDLVFDGTDIEELRHKTYQYFPVKEMVTLLVSTDHRLCEISGYVESNDVSIFSSLESAQISIICPEAWFRDMSYEGTLAVEFYGIDRLFEFPFSNESLTEKLIEFGKIRYSFEETFEYVGEVETGFLITIHALGDVGDITIADVDTNEFMTIYADKLESVTGSALVSGDSIVISTVKGSKYARLLRNGVYTNILNCLDRDSTWFQVKQGYNTFSYSLETDSDNVEISINVQNLFQGV